MPLVGWVGVGDDPGAGLVGGRRAAATAHKGQVGPPFTQGLRGKTEGFSPRGVGGRERRDVERPTPNPAHRGPNAAPQSKRKALGEDEFPLEWFMEE